MFIYIYMYIYIYVTMIYRGAIDQLETWVDNHLTIDCFFSSGHGSNLYTSNRPKVI